MAHVTVLAASPKPPREGAQTPQGQVELCTEYLHHPHLLNGGRELPTKLAMSK